MSTRFFLWIGFLFAILACTLGTSAPTPTTDLFATLSASTPLPVNPAVTGNPVQIATSTFLFTPIPSTMTAPTSSSTDQPKGRIVYTCQIYKTQASDQICIIDADGTGFRRLTTDDKKQHYYPSLSPDGKSVVYAEFREANIYEVYEMDIATGNVVQLTNRLGNLNAPEISPDGKSIIFMLSSANTNKSIVWMMDRNGQNPDKISRVVGWDPTWSPDGKYVLFGSNMDGAIQLYRISVNGKDLHRVSNLPAISGRSDWSPDGKFIVTYSGGPWKHEVYIMTADGLNARMLPPAGGNSQDPSFSPNGRWVTFTSYYDHPGDDHGCEIYIIRVDGTDLRRLTNNDYCDYQPRWGP
jgi:TolB protein